MTSQASDPSGRRRARNGGNTNASATISPSSASATPSERWGGAGAGTTRPRGGGRPGRRRGGGGGEEGGGGGGGGGGPASCCSHTGVDDGYVDGVRRKVRAGRLQQERSLLNALRPYGVADVDEDGVRVEREDDALHRRDVGIGQAEVAGEGDDRLGRHCRV